MVLISKDEDNLQRLRYRFQNIAEKFNMVILVISTKKTQSLIINKEPKRCKLAAHHQNIEEVMNFKYLEVNITNSRSLKEEIKAQSNRATMISGYLCDIIRTHKHISTRNYVKICTTFVKSVITYAIETKAETAATKKLLRSKEMLRSIAGYTFRDRKRNERKRAKYDIRDIVRWARQRCREWRHYDIISRAYAGML